jgi:hypothetical protein
VPPKLIHSVRVDSPNGIRVQNLFYEDGSIRFRVYVSPMVIEEAFLTGNRNQRTIIKLTPGPGARNTE